MPDTQKEDEEIKLSKYEPVIAKTPSIEKIETDKEFHETLKLLKSCRDDDDKETTSSPSRKLELMRHGSGNPRQKKKKRSSENVMDEQENSTNIVGLAKALPIPDDLSQFQKGVKRENSMPKIYPSIQGAPMLNNTHSSMSIASDDSMRDGHLRTPSLNFNSSNMSITSDGRIGSTNESYASARTTSRESYASFRTGSRESYMSRSTGSFDFDDSSLDTLMNELMNENSRTLDRMFDDVRLKNQSTGNSTMTKNDSEICALVRQMSVTDDDDDDPSIPCVRIDDQLYHSLVQP